MNDSQKRQIITMRSQGVGYVKIGKALDMSHNTVRSFCRRNGLDSGFGKTNVRCKQCGKPIVCTSKRKPKLFCSDRCRNVWWKYHPDCVERKAFYNFTCEACGKDFIAYGNQHRKYCSHACYIVDRYRKNEANNTVENNVHINDKTLQQEI